MASKIVIDPVTRIEGHLRMETEVTGGFVSNAWSTGTLFRGVEVILKNRDPRDAWMLTQRICGVCTYVHGVTSIRSVENALGLTVPDNARTVRNLLMGAQYVHDHIIHFYALHLLDWVDITRALAADPATAVTIDRQICSTRTRDAAYFTAVKDKLAGFVGSGQLGPFANGYWGHAGYKLSPEMSLVMMANYLEALRFQVQIIKMHAILGGKNPHPQSLLIGGVTPDLDFTLGRLTEFQSLCTEAKSFVDTYYLPDATAIAAIYGQPENGGYGAIGSCNNLLCFGEFPQTADEPASLFFPRGAIFGKATGNVQSVNVADITEHVARSWYEGSTPHNPAQGDTVPVYSGIDLDEKYSWLKAPRYNGQPMEVGPLARVMVAYGQGMGAMVAAVNTFLSATFLTLPQMYSTIGRTAARAIETKVIADAMIGWITELIGTKNSPNKVTFTMQPAGSGFALNEAPRGALGHWLNYSETKIDNYQMVVPSTWNFGPRDAANVAGPVEQALIGTPVLNDQQPLEVLRVIHSFDPCIACAVHLVNLTGDEEVNINVL
jgi:Ni,Fe-hydrogenase I large subunit